MHVTSMYSFATRCVTAPHQEFRDRYGATQTPVYLTATFKCGDDTGGEFDYTRSGNPTRSALQSHLRLW